ncbi:MAG TPA: hypothetical protein VF544_11175 [Pyrinomonadaceae bacterium]|jgi:hypothetical protein
MSVIGRLDDQTDAILITPLERRSRRSPAPAAQDEGAPADATEHSHTNGRTPDDERSSRDERERREQLPVWLL